jgi:hypothetical protein
MSGQAVKRETIYVELLDEGVEVWRPVEAERRHDGLYRILSRPHDETEAWMFSSRLGGAVRGEGVFRRGQRARRPGKG